MNDHSPKRPALDEDSALDFCLRLARAQAVLLRRLDNTLGNLHGVSFSDFQLLYHLQRAPGHRLRRVDLAERLALTASGVTRALLPLEKIGLVTRQPDPRDARVGYAVLTPTGLALLADAVATAKMVSQELLREIQASQLGALGAALAQIAGMNLSNS
ncbi:DNA-binding MarR family transcriptional regulator [Oxalobacteraceae bacterium GrIS 1.11]